LEPAAEASLLAELSVLEELPALEGLAGEEELAGLLSHPVIAQTGSIAAHRIANILFFTGKHLQVIYHI
jgi:hypothetical protein